MRSFSVLTQRGQTCATRPSRRTPASLYTGYGRLQFWQRRIMATATERSRMPAEGDTSAVLTAASSSPHAAPPVSRPALLAVVPGAAVFLVARLPSLIEPRWYTDEAGYASTALSLLHGNRLYSGIWTNKPPLQILLVAIPVAIDQRSEVLLHVLALLFGASAMVAAAVIAARLLSAWRAAVALLVAGLVLGTPIVDAELALPEGLLIAPATWAAAIVLLRLFTGVGRVDGDGWAIAAGALAAAAIAIQQTAVADAAALGLVILLSPRTSTRQLLVFVGTVAAITLAWLVVIVVLAGPGTVAYALAGFYVGYTQKVLPGSAGGVGTHLALVGASAALVSAGAVALRRSSHPSWALAVWSGATLLVPAAAQQPYPHFLAPSVIPGALLLASLPVERIPRRAPIVERLAALGMAAALVVAVVLARTASLDWVPPDHVLDATDPHTVPWYYGDALAYAVGARSFFEWQDGFESNAAADTAAADWITAHGLAGHRAVVWSADVWVHLLADLPVLMPTAPIYNDEVLLGTGGPVADRVARLDPDVVVTADDALDEYPEITPLLQRRYRQVLHVGRDIVWVRDDIAV